MKIRAHRAEYADVQAMRDMYRRELDCQIVHYSFLPRGLADPYVIELDGRIAGYGAVSNKYDKGRLVEFYTIPEVRSSELPLFHELLAASQATHIEAQTNSPLMLLMLYDCASDIFPEKLLFRDALVTHLACPGGVFRKSTPEDMLSDENESAGEWIIASNGTAVARGGFLCHYNPPFADVFMEVVEGARRQGFGSYLVQEVKRVCYEAGKKPAARCDPSNIASRKTLEMAGLLPCGHMLVGTVKTAGTGDARTPALNQGP